MISVSYDLFVECVFDKCARARVEQAEKLIALMQLLIVNWYVSEGVRERVRERKRDCTAKLSVTGSHFRVKSYAQFGVMTYEAH